jgi:HK97 family phage portal protein
VGLFDTFTKGRKPNQPRNFLVPALLGWRESGREIVTPSDYTSMINAYKSWVYICSSKNAASVASVPLKLYVAKQAKNEKFLVPTKEVSDEQKEFLFKKHNLQDYTRKAVDIVEVTDHQMLDLFRNVNPFMGLFDLLEMTDLHEELTGNGYWYVVKNNLGLPHEIWPMMPHRTSIVPDAKKFIKGYIYRNGTEIVPFDEDEIIHFKFPNPADPWYGASPLAAVADAYNINFNMNAFENALFTNRAQPEGVLESEESLTDKEFDRAKKEWNDLYKGIRNAGKTAVLEKGLKYHGITFSPKELNYLEGRKTVMKEMCAAYGVPTSKFETDNVNRANAESGDYQYMKETILPRLLRMESKINEKLIPLYGNGDRLFVAFDNPVPEDKEFVLKERELNLKTGYSSINEERKLRGKLPVKWGDEPYVSNQFVPLGSIRNPEESQGGTKPGNNSEQKPKPKPKKVYSGY